MSRVVSIWFVITLFLVHPLALADEQADEVKMEEIIVTATKTSHPLEDTPVPAVVVDGKEMKRRNALNAGEALRYLPGIHLDTYFAPMTRDALRIQGLPSRYTLILLDGERITGRHPLTLIPADVIERVEVVKGPSSVLYGSDAVGGVCNIITRSPSRKPSLNGTFSYGSYGSKTFFLNHGYSFGRVGYLISAAANRLKGKEKISRCNAENVLMKLKWEKDKQGIWTLRGGFRREKLAFWKERKFDLGLKGDLDLPNLPKLTLKYHSIFYHDEVHVGGAPEPTLTDEVENRFEMQMTRNLTKKHLLTSGMEMLHNKIEGGDLPAEKRHFMISSYLQDEMSFGALSLLLAGRLDYHSVWGSHFNPKVAFLYKPTDWLLLRTSIGKAFKSPTFKQLYRKTRHGRGGRGGRGFWIKGNPDLLPESSNGYNVELEARGRSLYGKVSLFRNDLRNMIQGFWLKRGEIYSYRNIGKALTQGAEMEIEWKPLRYLFGAVRYTYLRTKDRETGKEFTYSPHHRANVEISCSIERLGLSVTLVEEYVGARFGYREKKLPSYLLTHLMVNQSILKKGSLFLTINNLFGTKYEEMFSSEEGIKFKTGLTFKF